MSAGALGQGRRIEGAMKDDRSVSERPDAGNPDPGRPGFRSYFRSGAGDLLPPEKPAALTDREWRYLRAFCDEPSAHPERRGGRWWPLIHLVLEDRGVAVPPPGSPPIVVAEYRGEYRRAKTVARSVVERAVTKLTGETRREPRGPAHDPEERPWRTAVFRRDGYRCRCCGGETDLRAHHVKPYALHPRLRWRVDNGVTLCVDCHGAAHAGELRSDWTPKPAPWRRELAGLLKGDRPSRFPREDWDILQWRLSGWLPWEVGAELGVSAAAARRLEEQAVERLRRYRRRAESRAARPDR
jgi:5-methylcytosine-specific restriction endonuclease McrA